MSENRIFSRGPFNKNNQTDDKEKAEWTMRRIESFLRDDRLPHTAAIADRDVLNLALETLGAEDITVLRYSVDEISFDYSYDLKDNRYDPPAWYAEVTQHAKAGEKVVLVFEIPENQADRTAMANLNVLAKDRGDARLRLSDNVLMVFSLPHLNKKKDVSELKELWGVCFPIIS